MALDPRHYKQSITNGGVHGVVSYEYPNATDRLAAIGFNADDIYKLAIDLDTGNVNILTGIAPTMWVEVASALPEMLGGDLDGYMPNPIVINLSIPGQTSGSILYFDGSQWQPLAAGQDGYVLHSNGPGLAPTWEPDATSTGDVTGPGSSTDNAVVLFDGVTGKVIKNSLVTVSSGGVITVSPTTPTAPFVLSANAQSQLVVGLNADQLNGQSGAYYQDAGNLNAGTLLGDRFDDASHGSRSGGALHANATTSVAGFMSATDKTTLNNVIVSLDGYVTESTQVIAGTGLTGGGALTANVTLNVAANADGSIIANANDIQVGILATDAQHGVRGGGTQHSAATISVAGFMSAADKTKIDSYPTNLDGYALKAITLTAGSGLTGGGDLSANRTFTIGANADGSITVNADDIQVGILATDAQHGARGGGTQHSVATTSVAGFMSATDKIKLNGLSADGYVVGPASSTDEAIARFDLTTGKIIQNSNATITDGGVLGLNPTTATPPIVLSANGQGQLIVGLNADLLDSQSGSFYQNAGNLNAGTLLAARFDDTSHGARAGGTLHADATTSTSGFMSATDKVKINSYPTSLDGYALTSRTLTAGTGLTGGGDLSANRTFDVVANADGSIIANANDIQVGVLATDAQHGLRGGGTQHSAATVSVAGFMSAADKVKIDSYPTNLDGYALKTITLTAGAGLTGGGDLSANRTFDVVANADGSIVVNANDVQVGILATDAQHGVRGGGTQHAAATPSVAGFMSASDKTKLNAINLDGYIDNPGNTQGSILYNNGSDWVALPPSTDGYVLTTNGIGFNPAWEPASSSGGVVGGDLSGTLPNPTVVDLTISGEQHGSILYRNASNWVQLSPGSDGYVLTTHAVGSNPTWEETASDGAGFIIQTITNADKTVTLTDWGTSDPAKVPLLLLFATGAATRTYTLPSDASRVVGCQVLVSIVSGSGDLQVNTAGAARQNTTSGDTTTSTNTVIGNSGQQTVFGFLWNGVTWVWSGEGPAFLQYIIGNNISLAPNNILVGASSFRATAVEVNANELLRRSGSADVTSGRVEPAIIDNDYDVDAGTSGSFAVTYTTSFARQINLGGNGTITALTFPAPGRYTLKIVNSGAYTLAWPGSITWANGTALVIDPSATSLVSFSYDGTNIIGSYYPKFGSTAGTFTEGNAAVGGDLDGYLPNPIVTSISVPGDQGDILYHDGADWVNLPIGQDGYALISDGYEPVWGPMYDGKIIYLPVVGNKTITINDWIVDGVQYDPVKVTLFLLVSTSGDLTITLPNDASRIIGSRIYASRVSGFNNVSINPNGAECTIDSLGNTQSASRDIFTGGGGNGSVWGVIYQTYGWAAMSFASQYDSVATGSIRINTNSVLAGDGGFKSVAINANELLLRIGSGTVQSGKITTAHINSTGADGYVLTSNGVGVEPAWEPVTLDGYHASDFLHIVSGDVYIPSDLHVAGKLTVDGLIDPTGLVLTEQVSKPISGTATTGVVWVRDDGYLIFTNQDDNDTVLGSGGSGPGGSGDVVGPSSATSNAITRFNGTTGKLIKNSGITINDDEAFVGVQRIGFGNEFDDGYVDGYISVDFTLGSIKTITLDDDTIITSFTTPNIGFYYLTIVNNGNYTLDFPSALLWPNGGGEFLVTPFGTDVIVLFYNGEELKCQAVPNFDTGSSAYVGLIKGTSVLDFGDAPGSSTIEHDVIGQTFVNLNSRISIRLSTIASADHSTDEHIIASMCTTVMAKDIVAGVGFTIVAAAQIPLVGQFNVEWEYQ